MSIPINPKLPAKFSDTPNDARPASHQKWWYRPYIETDSWEQILAHGAADRMDQSELDRWKAKWFESWPSGTRYDVRCLDGGAWDRPTCWGMFPTLEEAIACAEGAPTGIFKDMTREQLSAVVVRLLEADRPDAAQQLDRLCHEISSFEDDGMDERLLPRLWQPGDPV